MERHRYGTPLDLETMAMPDQFPVFEVILKKRGRAWRWCVCTTEGQVVMQGSERRRPAAKYKADSALFLLLLGAPYRGSERRLIQATKFADPLLWNVKVRLAALGKARQWLSDHLAEADRSAGLPKTLRQPSLRLARCLRVQAVIRCTFGISDAQSRNTSPVQSCR